MAEQVKKKENKQQSVAEIYAEATSTRESVRKEIQGPPRPNYSHAFEKTPQERGELYTVRQAWREDLKRRGFTKRNPPITVRSKQA